MRPEGAEHRGVGRFQARSPEKVGEGGYGVARRGGVFLGVATAALTELHSATRRLTCVLGTLKVVLGGRNKEILEGERTGGLAL